MELIDKPVLLNNMIYKLPVISLPQSVDPHLLQKGNSIPKRQKLHTKFLIFLNVAVKCIM